MSGSKKRVSLIAQRRAQLREDRALCAGFAVAAYEISKGKANFTQAKQRDLYPGDQNCRIEWDRGYSYAVCAHRLGHGVVAMAKLGLCVPSHLELHAVVEGLLDGTWDLKTRPDPRKAT